MATIQLHVKPGLDMLYLEPGKVTFEPSAGQGVVVTTSEKDRYGFLSRWLIMLGLEFGKDFFNIPPSPGEGRNEPCLLITDATIEGPMENPHLNINADIGSGMHPQIKNITTHPELSGWCITAEG